MLPAIKKFDQIVEKIRYGAVSSSVAAEFPCGICSSSVKHNDKAVFCDQCSHWVHIECNDISVSEYKVLKNEPDDKQWICMYCTILDNSIMFPFTLVTDEALLASNDIENSSNYEPTPSLEIVSKLTNLPNLSDYDIDENLNPNISSQYYTLRELSSLEVSNKDFTLFHMNIRSLSLHYEELHALLTTANVEFQVIGLSEVKASSDAPLKSNIELLAINSTTLLPIVLLVALASTSNLILQLIREMIFLSVMLILRQFGLKSTILKQKISSVA